MDVLELNSIISVRADFKMFWPSSQVLKLCFFQHEMPTEDIFDPKISFKKPPV
jgi:hypothetical protein